MIILIRLRAGLRDADPLVYKLVFSNVKDQCFADYLAFYFGGLPAVSADGGCFGWLDRPDGWSWFGRG